MATLRKKVSAKIVDLIDEVQGMDAADGMERELLLQVIRHLDIARGSIDRYEKFTELTKRKVYVIEGDYIKQASESEIMMLLARKERNEYEKTTKNDDNEFGASGIAVEAHRRKVRGQDLRQYAIFREALSDSQPRDLE